MPEITPHTKPAFCPNPKCDFHEKPRGWRFKKDGFHFRHCVSQFVQRYRCTDCRRSFSSQTFTTDYWLKKPHVLMSVLEGLVGCSAYRQIARAKGVSPSTVQLHAERLGRHMLLVHETLRPREGPLEPIVLDGFETFEYSQYWPCHLNTVSGAESHFHYTSTVCELRRKGRMTDTQKTRREELEALYGRPDPKAIEKSVASALAIVVPERWTLTLRTDEHPAYRRALRRLPRHRFAHETTSSKERRTAANPLFPANLLHGLLRHGSANHKRETWAWSKRRESIVLRDAVHRVMRNYVKHLSEKKRDGTPAMKLRLLRRPLRWKEILSKRLFVTQVPLAEPLEEAYFGRIPTRQIPNARTHDLKYAF